MLTIELVESEIIPSRRLGRIVQHDPRSKAYPAPRADKLVSVRHKRTCPVFDQETQGPGETPLGSCTGNAAVGMAATEPFGYGAEASDALAVRCYSEATHIDRIRGVYPPTDTGSSGLAVMKVLKAWGWIQSYSHAFGLDHLLAALVKRPLIIGISWLRGCDTPDRHGIIRWQGESRGGHELVADEIDVARRLVGLQNSWTTKWGIGGRCYIPWTDLGAALADHGDATTAEV